MAPGPLVLFELHIYERETERERTKLSDTQITFNAIRSKAPH